MATQYDTYLSSLRRAKQNRPEMDMYKRNMQTLAAPFNVLNNQMASLTKRGGASTAKQIASLKEGRDTWNDAQNQAYTQALGAESGRQERLDMAIAETELKKADYEKHEADKKDAEKKAKSGKLTGALRTGLQLAGMGVGALLAPATGGASAVVTSALLGGAIGQTASGFVGVDSGGQLTVKPEDWDMELIGQGVSSVATQVAYNANQAATKDKLQLFSNTAPAIQKAISTMTPSQAEMFRFQLQNVLINGSIDELEQLLIGMGGM